MWSLLLCWVVSRGGAGIDERRVWEQAEYDCPQLADTDESGT